MKREINFGFRDHIARELFELRSEFFEQFPTIDSFELAQLGKTSGHCQRIP